MIEIIKVESKNVKDFVMFTFELYKDCDYWVPQLLMKRLTQWTRTKILFLKM